MTATERASLERLEDNLNGRLDRMETKIDGIDARVRTVEIATGGTQAAEVKQREYQASQLSAWQIRLGGLGILCSLGLGLASLINIHTL